MSPLPLTAATAAFALVAVLPPTSAAQGGIALPSNFTAQPLASGLSHPTDLAIDAAGRLWVTEQPGRVRVVVPDPKLSVPPSGTVVLDITDEVLTFHDLGLVGIALHPGFVPDGGDAAWIYLLYTVDRQPPLDIPAGDGDNATFGRLARWRANEVEGALVVDPESRQVLLGEQLESGAAPTAIAVMFHSHQGGGLCFGADGTLLVSTGDGARYDNIDIGGQQPWGFDDFVHPTTGLLGPIPKGQDVGALRAQRLDSLSGKVLRLDPETGLGLESNPFFDGDPDSLASRVFALGLRNPFRMAHVPGTGESDPELGDPGEFVAVDVGSLDWEEIDVVTAGANFGWPCFEGPDEQPPFAAWEPMPEQGGAHCAAPVAPPIGPAVAWRRDFANEVQPPGVHVDLAGAPLGGFTGFCAVGGVVYAGDVYPEAYHGRFVFGDYGTMWLKAAALDGSGAATSVVDFATGIPGPIAIRAHPENGDLVVLARHHTTQAGAVMRLVHTPPPPPPPPPWTELETFGLVGDVLTLAADVAPVPGGTVTFTGEGATPLVAGLAVLGTTSLELPLGTFTLLVAPDAPLLLPVSWDPEGRFELPFALPSMLELVGVPLAVQAFAVDPSVEGGLAASNGLAATIQEP